jgi:transposase
MTDSNQNKVTKNKTISEKRKAWLAANPDKHPWRRKNKFLSPPCEKVKSFLKEKGVSFVEEFQPLLNIGRNFSIDIAFPEKKIGIEVNGNQHYNRDGTLKPYYQNRSDILKENGWKLYELHYSLAYNPSLIESILEEIKIGEKVVNFDFEKYAQEKINKSETNKLYFQRKKRKMSPPLTSDDYKEEFANLTLAEISKILNRSSSTVHGFLKRNGLKFVLKNKNNKRFASNPFEKYPVDFFGDKDIDYVATLIGRSLGQTSNLLNQHKILYKRTKKVRCAASKGQIAPKNMDLCACGNFKYIMANLCQECAPVAARKVKWPTKEVLKKEVWEISTTKLAEKYGVSDNSISKWCEKYDIDKPPRGYWRKRELGYSHEDSLIFGVKKVSEYRMSADDKRRKIIDEIKNGNESIQNIADKVEVDRDTVTRTVAKYYIFLLCKLGINLNL